MCTDEMDLVTAFTSEKEINISWSNILICTAPKMLPNTQMTKREQFDELLNITGSIIWDSSNKTRVLDVPHSHCSNYCLLWLVNCSKELIMLFRPKGHHGSSRNHILHSAEISGLSGIIFLILYQLHANTAHLSYWSYKEPWYTFVKSLGAYCNFSSEREIFSHTACKEKSSILYVGLLLATL